MTPHIRVGSMFLGLIPLVISAACDRRLQAQPAPAQKPVALTAAITPAETCLGVSDKGVFADLDPKVQIALPRLPATRFTAMVDSKHALLVLEIDGFPRKAYPLAGTSTLEVGTFHLALRPGDRDELKPLLAADRIREGTAKHDRDGDGIPDALDVLIGAKKEVLNAESYTAEAEDYIGMKYPGGDVPRTIGVCTDVIVRAVRNAGWDLQKELHEDIAKARGAYPMVKGAGDPSIDQRRVGTLLPYFKRHWEQHSAKLDDPKDPWRPGDVIFMDTFPNKAGPDHIGIVSDRLDDQGLPLIVNNWTDGTVVSEMDLMTFVPVLYRFRLPP
jgi:uncharacterized protein YijF (DUF1287 family)